MAMVHLAVQSLDLIDSGFSLSQVSNHSLWAGRAMAMKLNSLDTATIQKQGQWSSSTFLMYIHSQIAVFSTGISTHMSTPHPFINVKGAVTFAPTTS